MPGFTIGNYLATRLEQIGIKHYFMVPGDYNLVLLDQLLAKTRTWSRSAAVTSSTLPTPRKPMPGSTAAARSLPP